MKKVFAPMFFVFLMLLISFSILSCGEEETTTMFTIETIGPTAYGTGQIIYINDSNRTDSRMTYIETDTNDDQKMIQYKYGFVDYKKEIDFTTSSPVPLSKYGITDPNVVETVESKRNDGYTYLFIRNSVHDFFFVDTKTDAKFNFGTYVYGIFWIDDFSNNYTIGQAILFNGALTTSETGKSLSNLNYVDFYTYDTSKSDNWVKVEGVFDNLTGGEMFFDGASNIILKKQSITGSANFGTIAVLIDASGKMKYLETGNYATNSSNYKFTDRTSDYIAPIFGYQDLQTVSIDYEYVGNVYSASDDVIGFSGYMCAVIQSKTDSSKYDLHAFIPIQSGSHTIIEDVYPGACSITYYSRATSAINFHLIPWVTYRSAKNELSVGSYDKNAMEFDTFLLDKGSSSNWMFAEKINSISKAEGNNTEIVIFYNDNESIKIAACNDQKKCGFDSSLQN